MQRPRKSGLRWGRWPQPALRAWRGVVRLCHAPLLASWCERVRPTADNHHLAVELEAPGRPLLVRNIGQELREDEVVVLQRRAAGG